MEKENNTGKSKISKYISNLIFWITFALILAFLWQSINYYLSL